MVPVLNILSCLIALAALPFLLVGVVPLLGSINYLAIIIASAGLIVGMLSSRNTGRNANIVVIVLGFIRLWFGAFLF